MSNPGLADIYSVSGAPGGWGTSPGPAPGLYSNMGIGGPGLPGIEWNPRGARSSLSAVFQAMGGGLPPTQHGHIHLKSHDFISQQYMSPNWTSERERWMMPDMCCFTYSSVQQVNTGGDRSFNAVPVLTLAAANQELEDQWLELQNSAADPLGQGQLDPKSAEFLGYLRRIGEGWLEAYHVAKQGNAKRFQRMKDTPGYWPDGIAEFYALATQDFFCWHTRLGIMSRLNWSGGIMNVNRGTSLEGFEDIRYTQHYTQVVVGVAKRVRVANVFGDAEHIVTGSKVWLMLTRKRSNGAYCIVPGGSPAGLPTEAQREYLDESGRKMLAWVWPIGVVATPPTSYADQSTCYRAANLGARCSEREAYEYHGTLPTMYLNMGHIV